MRKVIILAILGLSVSGCATAYIYRLGWEKSPMTLDDFKLDYTEGADGQFTQCTLTYSGDVPVDVSKVTSDSLYFEWKGQSGYMCKGQVMPLKCAKTEKGLKNKIPSYEQVRILFTKKPEYNCSAPPK